MQGLRVKDGILKELSVREDVKGFFDNEGYHYTKFLKLEPGIEIILLP